MQGRLVCLDAICHDAVRPAAGPVFAWKPEYVSMTLERAEGQFQRVSRTVLPLAVVVVLAGCASSPETHPLTASNPPIPSGQVADAEPQPKAGVTVAYENGVVVIYDGRHRDGKFNGHTIVRYPNGSVGEGPVVEGKRYGHWTEKFVDGSAQEGPYAEDRRQGYWVLKYPDGRVQEGPFAAGKRHGDWTLTSSQGVLFHGPYVDDRRHGLWTLVFPNSRPHYVQFVNGVRR